MIALYLFTILPLLVMYLRTANMQSGQGLLYHANATLMLVGVLLRLGYSALDLSGGASFFGVYLPAYLAVGLALQSAPLNLPLAREDFRTVCLKLSLILVSLSFALSIFQR